MMENVSPIGVFTTDINLHITSWNDWLEKATGIPEGSVRGKNIRVVMPDIEKRGLYERFLRVLTMGSVELLTAIFHHYLIRIPFPFPVGRFNEMQQRVTISPLSAEETIHGTLVTIEDVTDQMIAASGEKLSADLEGLSSHDWIRRKDAAVSLSESGKTIISEVLRKVRLEHRNPGILGSAMKIISMTSEDVIDFLIEFLNDPDKELRTYAAQMLGDKNTPETVEALLGALDDRDMNVKYHAIEALGKLRAVPAVDRLVEIALERNFFTSFPAIDALRAIGDSRSSRLLYPLMDDDLLGQPVLEALGEFGEADAVSGMAEMVNNNSPLVLSVTKSLVMMNERYEKTLGEKFFIAGRLAESINREGIDHLLSSIGKTSADKSELKSLITVLGWIDDRRIRRTLAKYLGDPDTRRQVIEAFVSSGQKVADLLISQLDEEDDIRQSAIMALGRIGGDKATEALVPLLKDDKVALITCGALSKIGDRKAFEPLIDLLGHSNPAIRRAAIGALNSIGHPEMEKIIPSLLADKNPHIRESALRIAGYFGYESARTFFQQLISDMDLNVRIAAIENLPNFEDERMISALICLYEDENSKIREAVVRSLGQVETRKAWLALARAICDKDEWVRYYAVKSIDNHGYIDVLENIKDLAMSDPVPFVRLAAIEYLGHVGGSLSASILSSLTGDPVRDVAIASVNSLGDIHHPDALPPLMALTRSTDNDLRSAAVEAIGRRGGPGTADVLQWTALTDKDARLKKTAISGLRNIATRESVNALLNLTSDPVNREDAISALASLPVEFMEVIAEGLQHRLTLVRTAVVEALLRIRSPEASELLSGCLSHDDSHVRLAAIYALHKLGNKKHIQKILALKESDPDPVVRKTVEDIVRTSSTDII